MPFLSHNQQHQSAEGKTLCNITNTKLTLYKLLNTELTTNTYGYITTINITNIAAFYEHLMNAVNNISAPTRMKIRTILMSLFHKLIYFLTQAEAHRQQTTAVLKRIRKKTRNVHDNNSSLWRKDTTSNTS